MRDGRSFGYLLTTVGAVAFGMFLHAAPSKAASSELDEMTERCRRASDNQAVISACSAVIGLSHYPKLLELAYNRRGLANERIGQFAAAVNDYTNVIRINPSIAGYFDNRMRAYKGEGALDLALADADTAVAMAPTYAFPLHGRGAVYFDKGQYALAARDFGKALALNPGDPSLHVDRGRALVKLSRMDEAMRDFDAARSLNPTFEPALRERGLALMQMGDRDRAREDLSAAVAIAPKDDQAVEALGQIDADGRRSASSPVVGTSGSRSASASQDQDGYTPSSGAPFCSDKDELQEYVLAALKHDERWMGELKSCMFVKGGLKMAVIDAGDPVKGMHVDKVRVFGPNGSLVGYTLTMDKDGS